MANQTITGVRGFRAAAMHCGIKASGKPDLALLVSDVPATAGAVFTRNKVVGAPVIVGREHIKRGILRGCVTNSGCANVCTGRRGVNDALEMCGIAADEIAKVSGFEVLIEEILPFSTGVIGHFLPMEKIRAGIPQLVRNLSDSEEAGRAFALGILTTDLVPKAAHATVMIGGKRVTISGNCKGSGMIAPNMGPPQATMLAYVATDAAVDRGVLSKLVGETADRTFNCVTVDQHTSTSDTFVVMANGLAGNRKIVGGAELKKFAAALHEVCDSLAQQIARDGEGATKLVTVVVSGAKNSREAKLAAEAIANSALCKTAIHGGDPNWGRFVSAAGYSGAAMNVERAVCRVGKIVVFRNGRPAAADLSKVEAVMKEKDVLVAVDLGMKGKGEHRVYTCDLSREYIAINADYHT
jgi:glutamate N-acetyltransferase/amino-acid N-acetyltransferase